MIAQTDAARGRLAKTIVSAVIGGIVAGAMVLTPVPGVAQEAQDEASPDMPTNIWAISRGGQLYDKWWAVIEADPPETTHPAYPAVGKRTGSSTWRCKECHGWDYKGADGAYGKGSHYTGIKGVRGVASVDPATIHDIMMDDTHRFTEEMMPHSAMRKLAFS